MVVVSRRAAVPALALVVLAAAPASAHTALSGSLPADGGTTAATDQVVLSFTGTLLERLLAVTVVGPDGSDAARGAPRLQGTDVVQPLERPLPGGRVTVSYRVVAADGHPLTGQVAFTVADAGTSTAAPTAAPGSTTARPSPGVAVPGPRARAEAEGQPVVVGLLAGALGAAVALLVVRRRAGRG